MKKLFTILLCLISAACYSQLIGITADRQGAAPSGNITYFGSASNPTTDNGTNITSPVVVTPPSSMVVGDLVYLQSTISSTSQTHSISATGGQTWNNLGGLNKAFNIWWCRFNGTWSANPSVAISGAAAAKSVVMHVFRPTNSANNWAVDQSLATNLTSAGTVQTITGVSNTNSSTVTVASWVHTATMTWTTLTGSGWLAPGLAQYRNASGSPNATTYAYTIKTSSGATGNVSKTTGSTVSNRTSIVSFYEF